MSASLSEVAALNMAWTYDATAGVYRVTLENGASFTVGRHEVSGKLENALNLYRKATIAVRSGGYPLLPKAKGEIPIKTLGTKVRRYDEKGKHAPTLEDLGL